MQTFTKVGLDALLTPENCAKMRYGLAILALVVSVTAAAPAALAQTTKTETRSCICSNGGGAVYVDGVARSSVQPATVTLYPPSEMGTVAGGGVHDVSDDVRRDQEGTE